MKYALIVSLVLFSFIAEAQSVSALAISKKGDSLFEIGEYNKAISYFEEINSYYKIAKSYESIGNNSEAKRYYVKALLKDEANPKVGFDYAKLLVRLSDLNQADSIFQNLHLRFPNNPSFIYERGLIKERQNDSTSIQLFLQIHKMDENNPNVNYKIARNYVENRKFKAAIPFIEKGLTLNNNSSRFLTLKALQHYYTQQFHEAITAYNLLILNGESNIPLHENLAKSYSQTNQFEKGLEQYNLLLKNYNDQNPQWHHEIAILYRAMKEYDKAKQHFNIAIGLLETPLSNEYMELATVYKREGDYKNEMAALRKSLVNNPNNERALYYLAVAADNYFKDKNTVLDYYENYLKQFGETGVMRNLVKQRVSDLKKELHFKTD